MPTGNLRLSPSGPLVTGPGGGPFAPGPGARTRLVQKQVLLTPFASLLIPTAVPGVIGSTFGATDLRPVLPLPNPGLQYRAKITIDVSNPATNVGTVSLYIDTSPDGSTWTEAVSNSHLIAGGTKEDNGCRQCTLELILNSGAALGVSNAPQSPNLYVRARAFAPPVGEQEMSIYSSGPDANKVGCITMELEETL